MTPKNLKVIELYLTDNFYVKKLLQGKLSLQLKNGIYGKFDDNGVTRLLYFPAEEIAAGKRAKDPAYECLKKCDKSVAAIYYNAFEPGRAGAVRWQILSGQMGLGTKDVRRCDMLTADFANGSADFIKITDDMSDAEAAETELLQWTCQLMTSIYSGRAAEDGVDLSYDPRTFPLLEAIAAQQETGKQAVASQRQTRPCQPYSYLDLFCELDGQLSMTDLTEILFEFYSAGLLSWPLATGRSAMASLADKVLTPEGLRDTPYQQAAAPYRYRSLPEKLYQSRKESCGLWLLDDYDFAGAYESLGDKQRLVMDTLIKRQLALFAPETANAVDDAATPESQVLHTASSLVRLLQVHAAGSQEDITEIMRCLSACRYINRQGSGYVLREDDRRMLSYLPEHLLSMDLYSRMRDAAREAVRCGKGAGVYKEAAEKAILQDAAEIERRIGGVKK